MSWTVWWNVFCWVCQNFLGNKKAVDYKDSIKNLLKCYSARGYRMSLKVHFLDFYLDVFRRTLEQYQMNMANDFTRTLVLWRSGTKVSRMAVCQPTTAGLYTTINRLRSIIGNRSHKVSNSVELSVPYFFIPVYSLVLE